nr:MAG TPA: hypothetical protein [Caudoviricetes sp.]
MSVSCSSVSKINFPVQNRIFNNGKRIRSARFVTHERWPTSTA